jgi:hypothetical protein
MGSPDVVVVPEVDVSRLPESIGQEVTRILGAAQLAADQIRSGAEREVAELQQKVTRLRVGLGAIVEQLRQLEWAEGSAPAAPTPGGSPPVTEAPGPEAPAASTDRDEPWPVPAEAQAAAAEGDAEPSEAGEDDPEAAEIQARVSGQIGVVEHLRRMVR